MLQIQVSVNQITNRIYPVVWRELQKRRNHACRTQTRDPVKLPPWPPRPYTKKPKSSAEQIRNIVRSGPPECKLPPCNPGAAEALGDIMEPYFGRPAGSCDGRPMPPPCPYCYRSPLCCYPPQLCPPRGPRVPQCEACQSQVSQADPTVETSVPPYETPAKQPPPVALPPLTREAWQHQIKALFRDVYSKIPKAKESPMLPLLVGVFLGGCVVGLYNQYACAVYKKCIMKKQHRPADSNPRKR